jgi:hypothetical protein
MKEGRNAGERKACTDKKENPNFLIDKRVQVAK